MEKKTASYQQKRQSILEAAIREFREKGYDGASMDRVAELSGASKRTVYNHFASKEDLFLAVVTLFATTMGDLKQIVYDPKRGLEDQLFAFAEAELALTSNPQWMGFVQVLLSLFLRKSELARKVSIAHPAAEDSLALWMKGAVEDGRLVADPALAARIFSGMLSGTFTWPVLYQGPLDPGSIPQLKRELVETFLARFERR